MAKSIHKSLEYVIISKFELDNDLQCSECGAPVDEETYVYLSWSNPKAGTYYVDMHRVSLYPFEGVHLNDNTIDAVIDYLEDHLPYLDYKVCYIVLPW